MPLRHHHDPWPTPRFPLRSSFTKRTPEETIDGPIFNHDDVKHVELGDHNTRENSYPKEAVCTDRAELIERIKRGESPTWNPPSESLKQEYLKTNNEALPAANPRHIRAKSPPSLSPAFEFKETFARIPSLDEGQPILPSETQRPSSALHAGDFTVEDLGRQNENVNGSNRPVRPPPFPLQGHLLETSPSAPWPVLGTPHSFGTEVQISEENRDVLNRVATRRRAPSLTSFSSSYVLKAPTTPLIQQSNNTDLDFSPRERSSSPDKRARRRTLPPHSFRTPGSYSQQSSPFGAAHQPHFYRRENSFPYSHHPRRSLNSNYSLQVVSNSPKSPLFSRSRRTSFSSEASPLQRAHLVGSYEESILRGWMSTPPSKPLDFTAQIGVLGTGNCKPKCPPHVTVPFPAVFYCYSPGSGKNAMNDNPSPYVGHIDLQHRLMHEQQNDTEISDLSAQDPKPNDNTLLHQDSIAKSHKKRHPLTSTLLEGSYRIPQQGQLQIIIKNPNKTAVKLFLVPYDLEGMGAGTKTFVRQRSYSADPVIDSPIASKPLAEPSLISRKPTLRYLIHINICSPARGRFYVYQQIRVVFANRVPDSKEQLQNEIQLPSPRYTPFKASKENFSGSSLQAGSKLMSQNSYRRRSAGFIPNDQNFEERKLGGFAGDSYGSGYPLPPVPDMPFGLAVPLSRPPIEDDVDAMDVEASGPTTSSGKLSPLADRAMRTTGMQMSSSSKSNSSDASEVYTKIAKGEGGLFGRPATPEPGEGLLSRKFRCLKSSDEGF